MIVAVTGSRLWPWGSAVVKEIGAFYRAHQPLDSGSAAEHMLIAQGEAKEGADKFARQAYEIFMIRGWAVELKRFPANWAKYERAAGPIRNAEMMEWLADQPDPIKRVLAFNYQDSSGTSNCVEQAEKRKLDVVEYKLARF